MRRAFLLFALLVVVALPLVSWPVTPQQEVLPGTARRSIYAAYDTLGPRGQTTLLLNNTTRLPMTVAPTVYSLDGAGIPLPLVPLEAHEHRRVDFREWIVPLGKDYKRGSLRLQFESAPFGLGAILSSVHEEKSQVVEAVLHSGLEFKSSQLEAVWFAPGPDARVTVAVLNITDHSLNAHVIVTREDGGLLEERIVPLAPHQTRFLNLRQMVTREKQRVGGISIRHGGQGGAVFAHGFVLDPSERLSYGIPFTDPATLAAAKFEGAGVMLGAAGGHGHKGITFNGRLLLRNISQALLTAEASLQSGQTKSTLGNISLQAGESRIIEVSPRSAPRGDAAIGISIPHSGQPGDMIAQWFSTEDGGMVVETPLRSVGLKEHVGGSNPFLLAGDYSSVTYIKNTGDEDARIVAWIQHAGGQFMLGLRDVPAGETLAIDIGKLRGEQTPDVHGVKLPPDLTQGNINWRWFDGPPIVGRTNVMSRKQSIASNRSCSTCLCSPINVWLVISDNPIEGFSGGSKSVTVAQFEEGCSGSINSFPLPPNGVTWGTFNPNVAFPDGQGNVLLGSAGNTQISVFRGSEVSEFVQTGEFTADGEPVGECQSQPVNASGFANVNVTQAVPVNFTQTSAADVGNGILRFTYSWQSSSGNLNHLSNCTVSEKVVYPGGNPSCWSAPFPTICTVNPTVIPIPGPDGTLTDNHGLSGKTGSDFRKPYFGASFGAQQTVSYSCGSGSSAVTGTLLGPLPIERSVSESTNNRWKYTITKPTNGLAKIDPLPE